MPEHLSLFTLGLMHITKQTVLFYTYLLPYPIFYYSFILIRKMPCVLWYLNFTHLPQHLSLFTAIGHLGCGMFRDSWSKIGLVKCHLGQTQWKWQRFLYGNGNQSECKQWEILRQAMLVGATGCARVNKATCLHLTREAWQKTALNPL